LDFRIFTLAASTKHCFNRCPIFMDQLEELLHQFGGLNVENSAHNNTQQEHKQEASDPVQDNDKSSQTPVWMKYVYTFNDIIVPIHDAIFPDQVFETDDKQKHLQIFNAIDIDNDGFISKREFDKITALNADQSVIPIARRDEIFNEINADKNEQGICFESWMNAISHVNLKNIPNNHAKPQPENDGDNDESNEASKPDLFLSVHVMTILKCMHNVWKCLGAGHREAAYQKALMYELLDNDYKIRREKAVPVYQYTRNRKKLYLVSMERIDLFVTAPMPTVIEMKAVSSKLSVRDEYQTKKYSKNRKCLSFLINCPNNRDEVEMKCWTVCDKELQEHDLSTYD